nr:glycosyltransferase [Sphingobacterium thalpophilum]
MAAYNTEKYIASAIQSILDQTYPNFELLIIDDCSSDNTVAEIGKFNDSRIRLLRNQANVGVVNTRNRALTEAMGEFIAIMDSDDIAVNNRFELLVNAFKNSPELALIGGHAVVIDPEGKPTGQKFIVETDPSLLRNLLMFGNNFTHSSVMIRTNVFREFNGYRIPLAEDYDLFLRISTKYPVSNLDEYLLFYRDHTSGISKKYSAELEKQTLPIKENILRIIGLPHNVIYQKMITPPFNWNSITIDEYKKFYIELFAHINPPTKALSLKAHQFIFQKWYEVIMNNGGKKTFLYFFNKPFFRWKYCTAKQLRRAFKNSIKNLFK